MQIFNWLPPICLIAVCAGITAVQAEDTPAQAAARAALMQKLSQMDQQLQPVQPVKPVRPAPKTQMAPAVAVTPSGATVMTNTAGRPKPVVAPRTSSNSRFLTPTNLATATPPAKPPKPSKVVKPNPAQPAQPAIFAPVTPATPVMQPGITPGTPPPLPISAAKQAQLDSLLQQYQSDQITPAQYQAERAKILAQP